jgi:hypothetical protein
MPRPRKQATGEWHGYVVKERRMNSDGKYRYRIVSPHAYQVKSSADVFSELWVKQEKLSPDDVWVTNAK